MVSFAGGFTEAVGFAKHHRDIQFNKHFDVLFCGYRHRKIYGKPTAIDYTVILAQILVTLTLVGILS